VDVYIDLLCPDSRDTFHSLTALKEESPEDWELRWHVLALPYHHNSFIVAGGAFLVANKLGPTGFFAYLDRMYTMDDIEDLILGPPTQNSDVCEVVDLLGERILAAIPDLSAEAWASGMATTSAISGTHWQQAIDSHKYCMAHMASGTPYAEVNGVPVSADSTLSTDQVCLQGSGRGAARTQTKHISMLCSRI
jgi:hypothetical protein